MQVLLPLSLVFGGHGIWVVSHLNLPCLSVDCPGTVGEAAVVEQTCVREEVAAAALLEGVVLDGAANTKHLRKGHEREGLPLYQCKGGKAGIGCKQATTVRGPLGPVGAHWRQLVFSPTKHIGGLEQL